eukprot:Gb_29945 [translate_table: standard]
MATISVLILLLILPIHSTARVLGPHMTAEADQHQHEMPTELPTTVTLSPSPVTSIVPLKGFTAHRFGYIFGFFPKGVPIPPSGPSKGHNSVTDGVGLNSRSQSP